MAYKIGSLLGSIVLLAACSSGPPPTTPEQQATARRETAAATSALTQARCEREQRCDNIGDRKSYSSMDDCLSTVRANWRSDLNEQSCPAGVNQVRLDQCVRSVRDEECGRPFETLDRIATCRSGPMCED